MLPGAVGAPGGDPVHPAPRPHDDARGKSGEPQGDTEAEAAAEFLGPAPGPAGGRGRPEVQTRMAVGHPVSVILERPQNHRYFPDRAGDPGQRLHRGNLSGQRGPQHLPVRPLPHPPDSTGGPGQRE